MWITDVDLLYWQARENGLAYVSEKKLHYPHFDWKFGFRLGAAYKFRRDSWEVDFVFTHFHTKALASAEGKLTPLWANPAFLEENGYVKDSHVRWRLHFGQFDLALAREFKTSSFLEVKPFLGVRVPCIRQKYRLHYEGGTLFPCGDDLISTKNKFLGTGILAGLNTNWILGRGWSLYAGGSFALAWGEFYVHQSEKSDVGVEKRLSFKKIFNDTAPIIDLALGLSWSWKWLEMHLAFEEHYFFSQNQLVRFISPNSAGAYVSHLGDLSLFGGVFGASFRF